VCQLLQAFVLLSKSFRLLFKYQGFTDPGNANFGTAEARKCGTSLLSKLCFAFFLSRGDVCPVADRYNGGKPDALD
jgi:hypothetical protein